MGPRRFSPAGLALVALAFGLFADVARASERLPIIVTYELERRHDAERVERRDPREYWVRQIMARLEDKKPSGTIGLKQPATVQVSFSVARDGTIVSKTIAKSSGSPVADQEALGDARARAALPVDARRDDRAGAVLHPSVAVPLDVEA